MEQSDDRPEISPYEIHQFLLALSDLEEQYGYISELEYALQMRELELYKKWAIDKKMWHPPESN